ncbi:MAG: spore coat protein [Xanthomonadaceae bacterium]|nr:spore coat protein [Xanthomonadaceae bacterium]
MKIKLIVVACAVAFASTGAVAATSTSTFAVQTNVTAACDVSASPMTFTDVNPLTNAGAATDGSTTVAVTCSNTTPYNIGLNAGAYAGATVTSRKMNIGTSTDTLNYELSSDSGFATNWGETVGTDTVADTGTGASQDHTVYGRIPSGQQTAKVGAYADTITVTVTY